ncbi:hypothetical protein [uncultured Amnibacterium sp.]|uniref:hypothetical protein n=1 Tax=uncultured Amnibacterium sp. TaxID=1631851 RepID=UPI0035CC344F
MNVPIPTTPTTASVARSAEVGDEVRLRPPGRSEWQAVAVALLALFGPVAVILVFISGPGRLVPLILSAIGLALLCGALAHRFSTIGLVLTDGGVTECRLIGRRRTTPSTHVRSALVLPLIDDRTVRTHPQLFLLDEQGRTRLRMRGQFWSEQQITLVANHFDVPVTRQAEPVSLPELRQSRRQLLSAAERHPILAVLLTGVTTVLLAFVAIAAALALLG